MASRQRQRSAGTTRKIDAAGVGRAPRELVLSLNEDDPEETPGSAAAAQRDDTCELKGANTAGAGEAAVLGNDSVTREAGVGEPSGSDSEADGLQCGICLNSASDLVRGKLDSCDHFFCFACIMHWAQTESKCPLCKQRFQKLREDGGKARTFRIPKRDQKYCPTEEEALEILEPYRHISCQVCGGGEQDALLLLCDRCDSAAHTFCVGFGHRVPDGDWLCAQCLEEGGEGGMEEEGLGERLLRRGRARGGRRAARTQANRRGGTRDRARAGAGGRGALARVIRAAAVATRRGAGRRDRRVVLARPAEEEVAAQVEVEVEEEEEEGGEGDAMEGRVGGDVDAQKMLREFVLEEGGRSGRRVGGLGEGRVGRLGGERGMGQRVRALRENWGALRAGDADFRSTVGGGGRGQGHRGEAAAAGGAGGAGAGAGGREDDAEVRCAWEAMERGRSMARQGWGARAGGDVRRQSRQEGREDRQVSVSDRATTAHGPPSAPPEKQRAMATAPPPPPHALPRRPSSSRSHALVWGVPSVLTAGVSSPMRSESSSGVSSVGGKVEEAPPSLARTSDDVSGRRAGEGGGVEGMGGMGGGGLGEAGFIEVSPESSLQGGRAWVRGNGEDEVSEWGGGGKRRRVEGVTAGGKKVETGGEEGRVAQAAGEAGGKEEGQGVAGAGGEGLASAAGVVPRGAKREGPSGDGPDQPVRGGSIHGTPAVSPVEVPGGTCGGGGVGGVGPWGVNIFPPLPPDPPHGRPVYHRPGGCPRGPPAGATDCYGAPPSHTWRDGGRGAPAGSREGPPGPPWRGPTEGDGRWGGCAVPPYGSLPGGQWGGAHNTCAPCGPIRVGVPGGGQSGSGGSWGEKNGMETGGGRGVGEGGGAVQQTASGGPIRDSELSALKNKIASRVKRILDPLYRDKKIGRDQYKETARVATHTLVERAEGVCGHSSDKAGAPSLTDCSLCVEQVVVVTLARLKAGGGGESGR